jgi:hypothetical protein
MDEHYTILKSVKFNLDLYKKGLINHTRYVTRYRTMMMFRIDTRKFRYLQRHDLHDYLYRCKPYI